MGQTGVRDAGLFRNLMVFIVRLLRHYFKCLFTEPNGHYCSNHLYIASFRKLHALNSTFYPLSTKT